MATELEKSTYRARLWGLTAIGLTLGIWDMVQESACSLIPVIGENILKDVEKVLGLELAGEKPDDVMVELGRILVDESGFASEAKVDKTDKGYRVTLLNAVGTPEFASLRERGVEKLFSHPVLCAGTAALARLGLKSRGDVAIDPAAKTQTVTFEIL